MSYLRGFFEEALDELILNLDTPIELLKPMLYSLKNGGKRLRPLMLLATLVASSEKLLKKGIRTAIALEFIHTYSLIHDDLPAMDDDDIRRGKPTSHVQFDEATAILAGDSLLTDAFGIIADDSRLKNKEKVHIIKSLSQAAGSNGMVSGQYMDVKIEGKDIDLDTLKQIHYDKTGKLFIFAMDAAGIIGEFDEETCQLLIEFAESFGVAYQIHNDLLDVTEADGHGRQSDLANDKSTYPALLGYEDAVKALDKEKKNALSKIDNLTKKNKKKFSILSEFIDYLVLES